MTDAQERLRKAAAKVGIGSYGRHVFLCQGPSCCESAVGEAAWEMLKKTMKEAGLVAPAGDCCRTKADCLRICTDGPILVVYPEGTWYHSMTADRIPRFVQQHLLEGKPVEEWIFARNPLK